LRCYTKDKFEAMKEDAGDPASSRPVKEYAEGTLVALPGAGKTAQLTLVSATSVSADTRVFRFALPTAKHILGLPVGRGLHSPTFQLN
jgi:hypothetical protein